MKTSKAPAATTRAARCAPRHSLCSFLRCFRRRASSSRETGSPVFPLASLAEIATAPLSPTRPHRNRRKTVLLAHSVRCAGCDFRAPARSLRSLAGPRLTPPQPRGSLRFTPVAASLARAVSRPSGARRHAPPQFTYKRSQSVSAVASPTPSTSVRSSREASRTLSTDPNRRRSRRRV